MEQALVFVSIVLGAAIASELLNLHHLLRAKNIRWHWAQPAFALFIMLNIMAFWWGAPASRKEISFLQFLPVMFQLVMLVLLAAVSLPDNIPEEGLDLRDYYQDNRQYQWIVMGLYFWSIHIGYVARTFAVDTSIANKAMAVIPDTIVGLIFIAMIFAKRWWLVAVGFAILSLSPLGWAARTLG